MGESAAALPAWEYASDVQVRFVGVDGAGRLGPLARFWGEPFELAAPARKFAAFKGQKNFTGDYWAATSRSLVGYESWVERDAAMALDFDPAVVALAPSPSACPGRKHEAGGVEAVVDHRLAPHASLLGKANPRVVAASARSSPRAWRRPPVRSSTRAGEPSRIPHREDS
ncbi:hypothetical protein [Streptomyces sp. NL15-2K]|uniref:hypothetical protein n=1 Tax=Streptomyces sp. NL15-2K TaxID=376149 RepID=UPI000FFA91D2|nr:MULTISPECIES: hypothetical protein [Actinomycetes]WKX15831.1 hypothetical protein Q4V64_53420 [Kutzneria buriramensis]GCB42774.1 hypothetical protein SNL152K_57 [Streptomyces sp. NL15-2K]